MIGKHCAIWADREKPLDHAVLRRGLSVRARLRILKVARTIADLDSSESLEPKHWSEAIPHRTLDRWYWGVE